MRKGVSKTLSLRRLSWLWRRPPKNGTTKKSDIEVSIDRETGDYVTTRRWLVVPDTELALLGTQFTTEEAAEASCDLQVWRYSRGTVENVGFGRIAAQTAKQVIVQRVRDAERAQIVDAVSQSSWRAARRAR